MPKLIHRRQTVNSGKIAYKKAGILCSHYTETVQSIIIGAVEAY